VSFCIYLFVHACPVGGDAVSLVADARIELLHRFKRGWFVTAVNRSDKTYKTFHKLFVQGVTDVESIGTGRRLTAADDIRRGSVASDAVAKMARTSYGRRLMTDKEFRILEKELEHGLHSFSGELDSKSPGRKWANRDHGAERALRFWGELGEIFHYFRDGGLSLNTTEESKLRLALVCKSQELVTDLEEILGHVSVQLAYDPSVISKMKTAGRVLQDLSGCLKNGQPLDTESADANLFQAGETIVLRQFVKVVCELCFRLFGCIDSRHIDMLLIRKSATADQLKLVPWLSSQDLEGKELDSRSRVLNRFIATALKGALKKAATRKWVTADVLKVFAQSASRTDAYGSGGGALEVAWRSS
jgi:hypothetical protein